MGGARVMERRLCEGVRRTQDLGRGDGNVSVEKTSALTRLLSLCCTLNTHERGAVRQTVDVGTRTRKGVGWRDLGCSAYNYYPSTSLCHST